MRLLWYKFVWCIFAIIPICMFIYSGKESSNTDMVYIKNKRVQLNQLSDAVTIVTASFQLGYPLSEVYQRSDYSKWMEIFGLIENPIVAFVDNREDYDIMKSVRANFENITMIIMVNQNDMWSFSLKSEISAIFAQPNYPQHQRNTNVPEYACLKHAKFELLGLSIKNNYFKTKYFAWLDIGFFRHIASVNQFVMGLPNHFDPSMVAYSRLNPINKDLTLKTIIDTNQDWVGGGYVLGRLDVLYTFTEDYRKFVEKSIKDKLMSSDLQLIYGMYVDSAEITPRVQIKEYATGWSGLGYMCKRVFRKQ